MPRKGSADVNSHPRAPYSVALLALLPFFLGPRDLTCTSLWANGQLLNRLAAVHGTFCASPMALVINSFIRRALGFCHQRHRLAPGYALSTKSPALLVRFFMVGGGPAPQR